MLILLLCIFIALLIGTYFLFKKDIMQPAVVFVAMYVVSIFCAVVNIEKWNIDFKLNTFIVLLVGAIEFIGVSFLVYKLCVKKKKKEHGLDKTESNNPTVDSQSVKEMDVEKIALWKILLICVYDIVIISLLLYNVFQIASNFGTFNSLSQALGLYKEHASYNVDASLPKYLGRLQKPIYAFAYVMMFFYLKNIVYSKEKVIKTIFKKIYYVIPSICFIIQEFLSSNRLSILSLLIGAFTMYIIIWNQKNNWTKKIKLKYVGFLGILAIVFLILFYFSASLVGRKNSKNMVDYITLYCGGSIECLNQYMQKPPVNQDKPVGGESFYYLIKNFYDYGLLKIDKFYPIHLEFRYNNNVMIGNVYTGYRRWINDFGFIGAFLLQGIMAGLYSFMYNKIRDLKKYKNFVIIMYGYMSYALFLHCIDGYLYLLVVRIAFFTTLLTFMAVYWFLIRFSVNKIRDVFRKNLNDVNNKKVRN